MARILKVDKQKHYVVGFMFSEDLENLILIEKQKPVWQKGKLNGVGGKIEKDETPIQAMIREFKEETGIYIKWNQFCTLYFENSMLHCFTAKGYIFRIKQKTGEKPMIVKIKNIRGSVVKENGVIYNMIPDLEHLIPLALESLLSEFHNNYG